MYEEPGTDALRAAIAAIDPTAHVSSILTQWRPTLEVKVSIHTERTNAVFDIRTDPMNIGLESGRSALAEMYRNWLDAQTSIALEA